jgi:hypothetical protein
MTPADWWKSTINFLSMRDIGEYNNFICPSPAK